MNSNVLINSLTEHLQQAVMVIEHNNKIIYCNDSAAQFWQIDPLRILGKNSSTLFHNDFIIQEKIRDVLKFGKVFKMGGYVLQTPPLKGRGAEIVICPVLDDKGLATKALITLLESTNLQESQAREQEEQVARSVGKLVVSLAHEIQNPLSGVKGMLQLLERDLKKEKIKNTTTELMLSELDRVERLLKQLLLHSQPVPLEIDNFDIHELLNTVILFEQSIVSNINFIRRFDTSLPHIQADRDKMHQVFLNLIRNAVEASSENDNVTIHTRYCGNWELAGTNLDPELNYILITIEDEGNGVSQENRTQLFKPLFTTKTHGHGLGLSISHRLVQAHKGLLSYISNNPVGSVFQIFLPYQKK